MKRLLSVIMVIILSLGTAGCFNKELTTDKPEDQTKELSKDSKFAEELKLSIALGNNARTITYNQSTPLELPDGNVVVQGDLKPTWQYIEQQLGIKLVDVTVQDQSASEMIDMSAATGFSNATVYGGNSIAEKLMNYGAIGLFVNLNDYLDQMPYFKSYLEEHPGIANVITAYDGGIYHIPYVAEIGNIARIFHGRESWFYALLDGDMASMEPETAQLDINYEGYWDRHDSNVITLQNAAAVNGKLTRNVALETLLIYIEDTYPNLGKPSDLFLGENAQYDIDELVALLRVVKLSPNTLSKLTTGKVVDGAIITPYFVRLSRYREDLMRLANYFGGQRVYGSDSYLARLYLDENGELQYSYAEDGFLEALEYMKDMYAEGLISSEFADLSNRDDFRKELYSKDSIEGHRLFGFMTNDWIASTTASNADVVGMLPPLTTVAGSDEMVHYVENTRVIKPDGWSISKAASDNELSSALKLFDYMFSPEGNQVQNYGIPENLVEDEKFTAADGTEYPKFNEWIFDKAAELKNNDISGFLRDFMGSQIPIGYQKEIGFELQYTLNNGLDAWKLYSNSEVLTSSYDAENPYFKLIPPVFSLNDQDLAKLGTVAIGENLTDQLFLYIIGASGSAASTDELKRIYEESGIDKYLEIYRNAYKRMNAGQI